MGTSVVRINIEETMSDRDIDALVNGTLGKFYSANLEGLEIILVIAGHHARGEFSGANGSLDISSWVQRSEKDWKRQVTAIYADGCNTATLEMITNSGVWRNIFPDVRAIAGFNGRSPLASQRGDLREIETMLALLEPVASSESAGIERRFKETHNWQWANTAIWSAGTSERGWTFYDAGQARSQAAALHFKDLRQNCDTQLASLAERLSLMQKLSDVNLYELTKLEDSFRAVYDWSAKWHHCEIYGDWSYPKALIPRRVLMLTYWNNLQKAFRQAYGSLARSSLAVDYENATGRSLPTEALLKAPMTLSAAIQEIGDHFAALEAATDKIDCSMQEPLREYLDVLTSIVRLESNRIPLRWLVEPRKAKQLFQRQKIGRSIPTASIGC